MKYVTKRGDDDLIHITYGKNMGMAACSIALGGRSTRYHVPVDGLEHPAWVTCLWCLQIGDNSVQLF